MKVNPPLAARNPGAVETFGPPLSLFIFVCWIFAAKTLLALQVPLPVCGWRRLFGIPCPLCGGTHALAALAELKFAEAFRANPAVVLGSAAVFGWFLVWMFTGLIGRRTGVRLPRNAGLIAIGGFAALIGASWLYLLVRGNY